MGLNILSAAVQLGNSKVTHTITFSMGHTGATRESSNPGLVVASDSDFLRKLKKKLIQVTTTDFLIKSVTIPSCCKHPDQLQPY